MPTDMLNVMMFNKPGFCNNGAYAIMRGDLLLSVKNPKGFPIDIRRIFKDAQGVEWISDQQTEDSWDDPGAIKLHVGNGGRGNRMCKRYVDSFPHTVSELDSPLYRIKDGKTDYVVRSAGPTAYIWNAPRMINWGGDVGNVLTYPVDYYWSGRTNREQYYFVPGWGLVKWNHMSLKGGVYSIDIPGDDPKPNTKLMSLRDWQKTYPTMTSFTFDLPFLAA